MKLSRLLCSSLFVGLAGCAPSSDAPLTAPSTGVHGVAVTPPTTTMKVGDTLRFALSVNADAGVDPSVTWTSSNAAVVTVDHTGLATALALGAGSVVATSKADGAQSGASAVTVVPKP